MADVLQVNVVAADRVVWSGEASQVIARTSEGDTGILPNHSPLLAVLVPSGVEVFSTGGEREVVAVDGGFISVQHNRVSILSEYASRGEEISLDAAEKELAEANRQLDAGDDSEETRKHYQRAAAQVKAAQKRQGNSGLGH
ncbi:F0F1 ATP synthase subunit epsilon [Naumannella sp. ID2617S]|uniref:ATP synthase epsilon chain n=1 Tax=Enemella dayhoffiae TaxID=2016507 RepID=A0A255GUK5_9ACTN|nr:F0F1 ATP synthase subunit epsilon [Enemella dayhoffiae]NNG18929.1 F0F1 ATP synthase subunit epsilon [Naumannella sp. ID2617S]OYO19320.1 ATP synthase F1 subunit epsilon [Enemella dayhoffiae]